MILFYNVFITDDRRAGYKRGFLPNSDPMDVFKYTLASTSVLPDVSKAIFYARLDTNYEHRRGELNEFIASCFGDKADIYSYRNERQSQWRSMVEDLPDELIWYSCNHDHPFMDYALDSYQDLVQQMTDSQEPAKSGYFSHWIEMPRKALRYGCHIHDNGVLWFKFDHMDSIQIVTKELLRRWWSERDYGNMYVPRSDWDGIWQCQPYDCFIPKREMCVHFDGYSHVMEIFPHISPLSIPPGFFQNEIKIRIGYETRRDDCVLLNPSFDYRFLNPNGTDYKWVLEDIPLFWLERISDIDIAPGYNYEYAVRQRNQARLDYMSAHSFHPDVGNRLFHQHWIEAHSFRRVE